MNRSIGVGLGGIVKLSVSAYELTDVTHPVVAEDTLEEVFTPGTAAAGYLGRQILGSARGVAQNVAGERTWPGQVFLVHLVCLVCLVGRNGKPTRRTKETR